MLEIDVQGALAVSEALPEALLVFVRAPRREEQRRRLEARGSDDPRTIERRLARAEAEERIGAEQFDAVVVNDDVDRAVGGGRCYPGGPPDRRPLSAATEPCPAPASYSRRT